MHKFRFRGAASLALALAICALLGAAAAFGLLSPGSARTQQDPAGALPSDSEIGEGPGGRTQLTRWTRREDRTDQGLRLGWSRGRFGGRSVNVPNDVEPLPYSGAGGVRSFQGSVAWYKTTFTAPGSGDYALSFHSASYFAQVWVDGRLLGSHKGAYLPFEFHRRLGAGNHSLVVRIDWRNVEGQSKEGFHRTWFNWGGLNGQVEVRPIGESELSHPTIQTTLEPAGAGPPSAVVKVAVEVHNSGPQRTITPEGTLVRGDQTITLSFPALKLARGQTATTAASVTVRDPALWSPASPSLYQLALAVGHESSYSAQVGLRELSWSGGRLYLNGQRLQLHGATIQEDVYGHGDALTASDDNALASELKRIGANAARAQHPLDPALLERLDAAGLLESQGLGPVEGAGAWYSTSSGLANNAVQQVRTAVLAAQLHPSIAAWNLADEVANNGYDGFEVHYVQASTRWLHAHDPTRMVAVDVWGDHPPSHPGALYDHVDAISETDYTGWYDTPSASAGRQVAMMRARLAKMERTFPGRVIVISEFGAESNALNAPSSPGGFAFQADLLTRHITTYRGDPQLSGMFIWVLRDYPLNPVFNGGSIHSVLPGVRLIEGLNQKGLFSYAGTPKPAVGAVARLFSALPNV
jgi:hypothetical protein